MWAWGVALAVWLVLACAVALWLGPRLRRADLRDRERQRLDAAGAPPGDDATPGDLPTQRRDERGTAA